MSISRSLPDEWIVLANSVCVGVRLPSGFLRELVGEDEQAVERGAQLVAHVREELGSCTCEVRASCLAFSSSCLAGLLDLAVLAFDLLVLLGQQAGLLLKLLVGLLQLLLAGLELLGERLGLLEQALRPHVGLDRVEHDADRLGELIEQRLVGRVEPAEARQFQHAADLALEDERQDQDAPRRGRRQGRTRCGCSPAAGCRG